MSTPDDLRAVYAAEIVRQTNGDHDDPDWLAAERARSIEYLDARKAEPPPIGDVHTNGDEPPHPADADDDVVLPPLRFQHIPNPLVIPKLDWHARGLWCSPTHGELAGGEKTLKTYLGLIFDIGIAAGKDVLGRFRAPKKQRVLQMIGEGGEHGYLRRVQRICDAYAITVDDVRPSLRYTVETAPMTSTRFTDAVSGELSTFKPDVLHLDPYYAYAPGRVDTKNIYEQGAALESIGGLVRDGGASLLFNNHFNQTGTGSGLQRISMAGHAEWCDSWLLVSHRKPADVPAGRFWLKLVVGSRQWGGAEYHVDLNIGRWSDELNEHVGVIHWTVAAAEEETPVESVDPAGTALVGAWRRRRDDAKTGWSQTEWFDRAGGNATQLRRRWGELLASGRIEAVDRETVNARGQRRSKVVFVLAESPDEDEQGVLKL